MGWELLHRVPGTPDFSDCRQIRRASTSFQAQKQPSEGKNPGSIKNRISRRVQNQKKKSCWGNPSTGCCYWDSNPSRERESSYPALSSSKMHQADSHCSIQSSFWNSDGFCRRIHQLRMIIAPATNPIPTISAKAIVTNGVAGRPEVGGAGGTAVV